MSGFLTNLADVLRAAGCQVVEMAGWQTRGRSGGSPYTGNRPWVIMWHHTASAGNGAQDAQYVISASDAPISNLVIGRDGIVYVCAAGPTNTNGKGGPMGGFSRGTVPADQMNNHAIGIEISNNGVGQTYPQVQIDACFAASNAMAAAYGLLPTDVANHFDWTPGRKIDCATAPAVAGPWSPRSQSSSGTWNLQDLRDECARRSHTTPTPPTPEPPPIGDDDMTTVLILEDARNNALYRCGDDTKSWVPDGNAAAQLIARRDETNANGVAVDGMRYTYMRNGNVDLIRSYGPIVGPRPDGVDQYGG